MYKVWSNNSCLISHSFLRYVWIYCCLLSLIDYFREAIGLWEPYLLLVENKSETYPQIWVHKRLLGMDMTMFM